MFNFRKYEQEEEKSRNTKLLDAVDQWAVGYFMLRELGIVTNGRLDAVLIPVSADASIMAINKFPGQDYTSFYDRVMLVGVELKASRTDFLKGLKSGQFERYDKELSGVYVATLDKIASTNELPVGIGHLSISFKYPNYVCKCKRHPKFKLVKPDLDQLIRIMFSYREEMQKRFRAERDRNYLLQEKLKEFTGNFVIRKLDECFRKIEDESRDRH